MSTVSLTRAQLCDILDVTPRQLRDASAIVGVIGNPYRGLANDWAPEQIRRLQVAASLARAVPNPKVKYGNTLFPAFVRAAFENPEDPDPPCWAIYSEDTLYYVRYSADVGRQVKPGAVVVAIDKLWPDTEGDST